MSIDRRAERGEEARQARCVENHCEIHAPLNPEWPLSKMCAGGGGPGEEGNLWGQLSLSLSLSLPLSFSLALSALLASLSRHQILCVRIEMGDGGVLNDYKLAGPSVRWC